MIANIFTSFAISCVALPVALFTEASAPVLVAAGFVWIAHFTGSIMDFREHYEVN